MAHVAMHCAVVTVLAGFELRPAGAAQYVSVVTFSTLLAGVTVLAWQCASTSVLSVHACGLQAAEPAAPQATRQAPLPQLYHGQLYNAVLKLALAPLHPDAAASCSVRCADTQGTASLQREQLPAA